MHVLVSWVNNIPQISIYQCCGSLTFWYGSGSADLCLWLKNPAPDPAIFVTDLSDANKKLFFFLVFLLITS